MRATHNSLFFLLTLLLLGQFLLAAQSVQVDSAVPNTATQGTINLDVSIGGKGFKQGAAAQWLVTGTTNPGGVTVNSTTFVNSTQLNANITVSATANISGYDISVKNSNGSSGKGTGLFSVTAGGGGPVCTLAPLPSQFSLITTLNDTVPTYTGLGSQVRIRQATLGGKAVLVTAVGSSSSGKVEVFFLDPSTGTVLDGTVLGTNTQPQAHITIPITIPEGTFGTRAMAIGDLNADGIPDIVIGDKDFGAAFAFVGSVDANGILSYSNQISFPAGPGQSLRFGYGVAMGDLDGSPGDEVAIADTGFSGTHGNKQPGGTYLYHFSAGSFTLMQTIGQPSSSVAIGDVTGDANNDLIVGALVYTGPSFTSSITLAAGGRVDAARVLGGTYSDVIVLNNVFAGPISAGEAAAFSVNPLPNLTTGYGNDLDASDLNGDGLADILVGAPNTQPSNACPSSTGTAYVFLSDPAAPTQPVEYALEPPTPGGLYGWAMGAAPGTRIFLVGEIGRTINGVANAGQVWVYKVN